MSSWSPYNYTENNPISNIDPDGRMSVSAIDPPIYAHQEFQRRVDNIARSLTESIDNAVGSVGDFFGGVGQGVSNVIENVASFFAEGNAEGNPQSSDFNSTSDGVTIMSERDANATGSFQAQDGNGSSVIISTGDFPSPGNTMTNKAATKSNTAVNTIDKVARSTRNASQAVDRTRLKVCTVCGDTLKMNEPQGVHTGFDTIQINN